MNKMKAILVISIVIILVSSILIRNNELYNKSVYYKDKADSLSNVVVSKDSTYDALMQEYCDDHAMLSDSIYFLNLNFQLKIKHYEKLNAVNKLSSIQSDSFFTNRYRQ